jgi:predicted esterase
MTQSPTASGSTRVALDRSWQIHIPAGQAPSHGFPLLLGLHGFGEDGGRLAARLASLDGAPYARLFPDAPFPVEVREAAGSGAPNPSEAKGRGGRSRIGASWYQYTGDQELFLKALAFAEAYLRDVVADAGRAHPIDASRIVLLGYSQGGYLAGVAAFRDRARYRGLVGVACRIKTEALAAELAAARGYPALLIHGARDEHTAADRQREAHAELVRHGVDVTLHVHEGGHGFRSDLAPLIDAFTRRVLGV